MESVNNTLWPSAETFPEASPVGDCIVCGAREPEVILGYNGFRITRCRSCGIVYADPVPSERELAEFYARYAGEEGEEFRPHRSITRRLKYAAFVRFIQRYFHKDKKIRTLEIGCSQGDLLAAVRGNPRFEARGIDYAVNSVNYARSLGLDAEVADLFSKQFPDGSFDLVVAIHVVEHVRDPVAWLREIHRVLAPGGIVFLVTPGLGHPKQILAGKRWKYWGPPGHLWHFSPFTIRRVGEQIGLQTVFANCLYHRAHLRYAGKKPVE